MASFTVEHETKLSQAETYSKIKKFFQESDSLKKLDADLQTSFNDSQYTGDVKGSRFSCEIKVMDAQPAKVVISVKLSLMLTPFKGKIQETLQQKIQSVLG